MPTVDANIWVASFDTKDCFHADSAAFLRNLASEETIISAPGIVILEVACALARRFADPAVGHKASVKMKANSLLRLEPLGADLLSEALRLGTRFRLRAADALYVATAALRTNGVLVSWDNDLIERAGAVTPTAWLAAHRQTQDHP
jgi:predicted nucleic acid-binding protein